MTVQCRQKHCIVGTSDGPVSISWCFGTLLTRENAGPFLLGVVNSTRAKVRAYSRFPERHVIRYVTINLNRAGVVRSKQIHALSAYNVVGRFGYTRGATRWHRITVRSPVEGLRTWTPVPTQTAPMRDFGPITCFIPTRCKNDREWPGSGLPLTLSHNAIL